MKAGDICEGIVTRIEHFGLFVEVDGIPGLLRVVELTWDSIRHPSEIASVGDCVRFQVFNLNDPNKKPQEQFNGSIKILTPWNMPDVDATISKWQASRNEIGMIQFHPTGKAGERFPYNVLPANSQFLGVVECDALCLEVDGSLRVYDHEVAWRILCEAALDQKKFVEALVVLQEHFDKCVADDSYYEDETAAVAIRERCTKIAGGDKYEGFYSMLVGW